MGFSLRYAEKKHSALEQTYDGEPYIVHLKDVMNFVRKGLKAKDIPDFIKTPYPSHEFVAIRSALYDASALHDTIEDTDVTFETLITLFGEDVALIVKHVSDPDDEGLSRKQKKEIIHERLSKFDVRVFDEWGALIVKTADRLSNYKRAVEKENKPLIKMYYKEHLEFRKAVWRSGLVEILWEELQEIDDLVSEKYNFKR